jgi:hypothetical protein
MASYLTDRDKERVSQMLRWFERHKGQHPILHGFRNFAGSKGGTDIRIFEVQSNDTGDGIYNCREEELLSEKWDATNGDAKTAEKDTTSYEILNLFEHDPDAAQHDLSAGDFLIAWQMTDDDGDKKWVGIPLVAAGGGEIRIAKTQVAAGADTKISCKLLDAAGNEIGDAINVYCKISGGGNLNACIRRLASGDTLVVMKDIDGKWYATEGFQTIDDTKGLEISSGKLAVKLDTTELEFESGGISTKISEC